jgi:hypothetical protein
MASSAQEVKPFGRLTDGFDHEGANGKIVMATIAQLLEYYVATILSKSLVRLRESVFDRGNVKRRDPKSGREEIKTVPKAAGADLKNIPSLA